MGDESCLASFTVLLAHASHGGSATTSPITPLSPALRPEIAPHLHSASIHAMRAKPGRERLGNVMKQVGQGKFIKEVQELI